jgi:hypothetical protein
LTFETDDSSNWEILQSPLNLQFYNQSRIISVINKENLPSNIKIQYIYSLDSLTYPVDKSGLNDSEKFYEINLIQSCSNPEEFCFHEYAVRGYTSITLDVTQLDYIYRLSNFKKIVIEGGERDLDSVVLDLNLLQISSFELHMSRRNESQFIEIKGSKKKFKDIELSGSNFFIHEIIVSQHLELNFGFNITSDSSNDILPIDVIYYHIQSSDISFFNFSNFQKIRHPVLHARDISNIHFKNDKYRISFNDLDSNSFKQIEILFENIDNLHIICSFYDIETIIISRDPDTTTAPGFNLSISYDSPTTPRMVYLTTESDNDWSNFTFTSKILVHYSSVYPGQITLETNDTFLEKEVISAPEEDLSNYPVTVSALPNDDSQSDNELSTGVIVGILIAAVIMIALISGIIIFFIRRKNEEFENS